MRAVLLVPMAGSPRLPAAPARVADAPFTQFDRAMACGGFAVVARTADAAF